MLTKFCAVLVLLLAASPFTAPFQTCHFADLASGTGTDGAVMVTPPTGASIPSVDEASSIPPLRTETGHVRLAPVSELVNTSVPAPPPLVFLGLPIDSRSRITGYSVPPSVLRR
jgi:hypothetical protein